MWPLSLSGRVTKKMTFFAASLHELTKYAKVNMVEDQASS